MLRSVSSGTLKALADDVTEREQWLCWRREKRTDESTKVPITPVPTDRSPYASCTDPATWGDCQTALKFHRDGDEPTDGIGYVFINDGPLVGVDLDDCRDPTSGAIDDWAHDVVIRLDSYTEVSPSGMGLHVLVRGTQPEAGCRSGSIEIYDDKRYFTVTGEHLDQTPRSIEQRQAALEAVHEEYIQTADDTDEEFTGGDGEHASQSAVTDGGGSTALGTGSQEQAGGATAATSRAQVAALTDEELLQRARAANDGGKFTDLWRGRWQAYAPARVKPT